MNVRRRFRRLSVTVVLTALVAPVLALVVPSPGAVGQESYPLRVAGELPAVKGPTKLATSQHNVLAIDAEGRRLFLHHVDSTRGAHVVTYDIRSRIPRQIGIGRIGVTEEFPYANMYTTAFDAKRGNLALLSVGLEAQGHNDSGALKTSNVVIYSDKQHKVVDRWNIASKAPGFFAMGMTYSAADDMYYFVGDHSGMGTVADGTQYGGGKPASPGAAVVAVNAKDGSTAWVRVVPQCQMVLFSKNIGAMIARSKMHDAVYFTCVSGGTPGGQTYPGQAGLVRLSISQDADTVGAMQLPVEFFAISGNYFAGGTASGIAAFDSSTDRFYVQSLSFKTPGAWVFDGRLSGWVGFVAAEVPKNYYIGVNEGMSHLYMGITSSLDPKTGKPQPWDGIIVSDVRQTPVPAGEKASLTTSSLIVADPKTNRLFVRPRDANAPYLVVEDMTPVTKDDVENDYDAETSNLADTPDADVFYAAGATGYGAQVVQVGGADAPLTAGGTATQGWPVPGTKPVGYSTRAVMSARVGYLDLRAEGAAASAQASTADSHTEADYEQDVSDNPAHQPVPKEPEDWPYAIGSCLDSGGDSSTKTPDDYDDDPANPEYAKDGTGTGSFTIVCNLAKNTATAKTRLGPSGTGSSYVNGATYEATSTRTVKDGALVTTKAVAEGTTFALAGGYTLRIGKVVAESKSVAHGRPKTATSDWSREVSGIKLTDSAGKVVFSTPGCASHVKVLASKLLANEDTCAPLAKTLNELLQTRLRIDFPLPSVTGTPKGAFAGVEQSPAEYYTQSVVNEQGVIYPRDSIGRRPAPAVLAQVYNDTAERSRTVVALAATQSNAVFQVNPPFKWTDSPPVDPGPVDPGGDAPIIQPGTTGGSNGGGTVPPVVTGPQGPNTTALPVADASGFLFLRRGLRDMVLLLLLGGLMLSGAGAAARRRRLVDVLVTVPGKEATP